MIYLILGLFLSFSLAYPEANFNLPMQYLCNGQRLYSSGAAICAQWGSPGPVKVKIPPSKGQFRALDCNEDLTKDKNPDDFNTQINKVGWWIFSRTLTILTETPIMYFPDRSYNDCPIIISVVGDQTGIQTGILVYDSRMVGTFLEMACGSEPNYFPVDKVGSCVQLSGARLSFRSKETEGTMLIVGSGCGINTRLDLSQKKSFDLTVPNGVCLIDFAWVTSRKIIKSRVLVVGHDRGKRELDNPFMVRDAGSTVKVFKPLGSTVISTEVYIGDKVQWRSGLRTDDSYTLDPNKDGGPWTGGIMCHNAYSDVLQSTSQVCYTIDDMKEVPYLFK